MMRTRSFITGMILLAGIFIFISGEALAFSDEPCTGWNYNCGACTECVQPEVGMIVTDPATQWTIKLDSVSELPDGNYDFLYKVTSTPTSNTASGLNFVAMLIPDCCVSPPVNIDIGASYPFKESFAPGVGESTLYFGRYVMNGYVVKGTSDSTVDWHLISNTNRLTMSTMIIKLKKDALTFKIAVPGCPAVPAGTEPLVGSRSFSECSNFGQDTIEPFVIDGEELPANADDISFYVIRNTDRDGCVSRIWRCIGLECDGCSTTGGCATYDPVAKYGCEEIDQEDLPWNVVTQTAFIRTCPDENISVEQGSPYYLYTVNSGGYTYQSCLDLGTYRWVPLRPYCIK
jgi:hypothetical protein